MKAISIHAHFYQPPREDPWLDAVLQDPTAAPAHDWNARVADECYTPNRAARLVDGRNRIITIVDNYRRLNFNVGPTLHAWFERHRPDLARHVVLADRHFRGAIAQAYNHMIMPLAMDRDKLTQVRWGLTDFQHRYGRKPEGMWLPETAVDIPTLEALAACGVTYTILAPHQCAAVRTPGGKTTVTPGGHGLDVTRPYRVRLPSGKSIITVFYHGELAQGIAFGGLLESGDRLATALLDALPSDNENRLLVVATDGETFGHHHRFGEMALARAFQVVETSGRAQVLPIAEYLRKYPPQWEATIAPNTSWSCAHGIERWRSNCGCHTGGRPGWHQKWRAPLKQALDALRDRLDGLYEQDLTAFTDTPWTLRDESIALLLDQHPQSTPETFLKARLGNLDEKDARRIRTHLEAQRMRLFMYTSCGWFFNDISGIETAQILAYATRAAELGGRLADRNFLAPFLKALEKAPGNTTKLLTGRAVAEHNVLPHRRDLERIAAEAALLGTTKSYFAFSVSRTDSTCRGGEMSLTLSRLEVKDKRTGDAWQGSAAVLSGGGLDDACRLAPGNGLPEETLKKLFFEGDLLELTDKLEQIFPKGPWGLPSLPTDQACRLAAERTQAAEKRYREQVESIADDSRRLLVRLNQMGVEPPAYLKAASELAFKLRLEALLSDTPALALLDPASPLGALLEEAHGVGLKPELSSLAPRLALELRNLVRRARLEYRPNLYEEALRALVRSRELSIDLDAWKTQNETCRALEATDKNPHPALLALARELGFSLPGKQPDHIAIQ